MRQKDKKNYGKGISPAPAITSELKGKQSVRATFRLTQRCIDAIRIVATQMGIKQKSLFEHLAEDIQSLKSVAEKIKIAPLDQQNRIQKTFVISRKSLSSLDEIAKNFNTHRDALIELSIERFLPLISKERRKHKKRKEFLLKIKRHFEAGETILDDIKKQLGNDDPIIHKFRVLMSSYESVKNNLETFIDRSKGIEEFDTDGLNH